MTDKIEADDMTEDEIPGAAEADADPAVTGRPDYLPAKFWDQETGQVRTEELAQSYRELERRLGADGPAVPDGPEGYAITPADEHLKPDPEINARLFEAGFSQRQAQLVYDLAAEKIGPMMAEMIGQVEAQRQVERLSQHFGGQDKWSDLSHQLSAWGRSTLPPDVYQALASSYDGVLALHRMMTGGEGEPGLGRAEDTGGAPLSEGRLRRMMDDPRYWRDQDPDYMRQVQRGFEALYGGS